MSRADLSTRPRGKVTVGCILTGALAIVAITSRFWTPEAPTRMRIPDRLKPPFSGGFLGTDAFGRDVASMLMAGAWNSLSTALLAVTLGAAIGVALGLSAAERRGGVEQMILRSVDLVFALPALVSAIMITAVLGPGQETAVIAIGLFTVPVFARVAFGAALREWAAPYCLAAKAAGMQPAGVAIRHVLPNIGGTLAVQFMLQLGLALLVEAGLSFLGLGVPPPAPTWGRMLFDAQTYLEQAPWLTLAPGLTILLAVLGFNLIGQGLRDLLDPRVADMRRLDRFRT